MNIFSSFTLPLLLGLFFLAALPQRPKDNTPSLVFNTIDFPGDGLTIVHPRDPQFEGLFQALLSRSDPKAEKLRALFKPYSVFVKHSGHHAQSVVACSLVWEFIRRDGSTQRYEYAFEAPGPLLGRPHEIKANAEGHNLIRPGSFQLVCPLQIFDGTEASDPAIQDQLLNELQQEFSNSTSVTLSIDGVFLEDGKFVGPVQSRYFDKFRAKRDARHDVLVAIGILKKEGKSADEIWQRLQAVVKPDQAGIGDPPSPAQYYAYFRGRVAAELLRMRDIIGDSALDRNLADLRNQWPKLHKGLQ